MGIHAEELIESEIFGGDIDSETGEYIGDGEGDSF